MTTGHSPPDPAKSRIATAMGKASILMEALPYIQRFAGKVVVVKYGGSMMTDVELSRSFAGDITFLSTVGVKPVIVHGGGPQISEALTNAGIRSEFVDGLRVTDHETMRIVQRMLVGEVNADIVAMLASHGAEAIGVSGLDANLLRAVPKDPRLGYVGQISEALTNAGIRSEFVDGLRVTDHETMRIVQRMLVGEVNADIVAMLASHGAEAIGVSGLDANLLRAVPKDPRLGYVGQISHVNTGLIESLLDDGLVPVIAPIAMGEDGHPYNVNADTAAASIAGALGAQKLLYLTDVEGVYADAADPATLVSRLDRGELSELLATVGGGMLPKLESVASALDQGVRRAHILDGRVQHVVLLEMFTRAGVGTMATQTGDDRP